MKKLFFIGLAATAMLTSCNNDEVVEMAQSKAIGFSNAFVNNGTRSIVDPSFTKESLGNFAVYGFTQNGQIFYGTTVSSTDGGETWTYSPPQYWVAGNTYTFGAIAPAATDVINEYVANNKVAMTVNFTNDGTTDLLHAAPEQVTDVTETYNTPVSMTFNHQLSKVKFSFENAVGEGYNVMVTNIMISNAKQSGTLTIDASDQNTWSGQNGSIELPFGNVTADDAIANEAAVIAHGITLESYYEKLIIPTDNTVEYTVTFTAGLYQGNVPMGTFDHSVKISGIEFKLGYCYDFKATLTHENISDPDHPLQPIEFTVEKITDWNNEEIDQPLDIPTTQQGS